MAFEIRKLGSDKLKSLNAKKAALVSAKMPVVGRELTRKGHGMVTVSSKIRNLSRGQRTKRAKSKGNKNLR